MLLQKKSLFASVAVLSLLTARSGQAQDPGLQIAGDILQAIGNGLNGGNMQPPPVPYPAYPPAYPPGPGGFPPPYPPGAIGGGPNPVVFDTGATITDIQFDASGRPVVITDQTIANQSAADPNRNVIDPGSYQTYTSTVSDAAGNTFQEVTELWTSYGVPHSNSYRQLVSQGPGGTTMQNQTVVKAPGPGRPQIANHGARPHIGNNSGRPPIGTRPGRPGPGGFPPRFQGGPRPFPNR